MLMNNDEVDARIQSFMGRKAEQYPELLGETERPKQPGIVSQALFT